MSAFEAELNALAASASVTSTPHIKGGSTIDEISNRGYASDDAKSQKGEFDEGKYKIDVDTLPGGNDKNLYEVCLVDDLVKKDPSELCRQKRSGGENTFCIKIHCNLDHTRPDTVRALGFEPETY